MDRKEYLFICQRNAVISKSIKVKYMGAEFHPKSLEITFNKKGETMNFAVLESVSSNSVTYCRLQDVEKWE